MIAAHGSHLRITAEGVLIFLGYGLFYWRIFRSNPGNRLIECGSITLIVFLPFMAMIGSNDGDAPGWLFGASLILIVLLCFATLFFLFQRVFRALVRRFNQ
jgi:Na+/melibiose symporter-like transporter